VAFCSNGYHHSCPDNLKMLFPPERMTEAVFRGTPRDQLVCAGDDQFLDRRESRHEVPLPGALTR
jgi:hypothetical protein